MNNFSPVKEKDIKAALVDWLYARGMVENAVIINEMVVANWSRRADIAVANGRLYGFEIKSEADSLRRLSGQIDTFSQYFDKVTIVAASKFIREIVNSYPDSIGVLEVYRDAAGLKIRQVRSGRINEIKDHSVIAGHLTKNEIETYLRVREVSSFVTRNRSELEKFFAKTPLKSAKQYLLDSLKKRYRDTFESFERARQLKGTYDSLTMLSKAELMRKSVFEKAADFEAEIKCCKPRRVKEVNLDVFAELDGFDLSSIPRTVLPKRR